MNSGMKREKVFESICKATRANTLGLFIGSGFTKALFQDNPLQTAYTWSELLAFSCKELDVDSALLSQGKPYPEVATNICRNYAKKNSVSIAEAERELKFSIAKLVDISPSEEKITEYGVYFKRMSPNWIVTTNYDSMIEKILKEKAFSINPNDSYIKTKDFTPVYHIHGSRTDPCSIVVTNEDYTRTLRLSDYRHVRLPFLLKESTVLMIGYSLNDLNVLSAVDYSKNVYTNISSAYETPIIQLLHRSAPIEDPYIGENGIIIQEISDLSEFFSEYLSYEGKYRSQIGKRTNEVNRLVEKFNNADDAMINKLIDDQNYRLEIIKSIRNVDYEFWYVYPGYTAFLNRALGILWTRARTLYAFEQYEKILALLLDIIENINYSRVPESFIDFLVDSFDELAPRIGNELGQSWKASELWDERKRDIPQDFCNEFLKRRKTSAKANGLRLIDDLIGEKHALLAV